MSCTTYAIWNIAPRGCPKASFISIPVTITRRWGDASLLRSGTGPPDQASLIELEVIDVRPNGMADRLSLRVGLRQLLRLRGARGEPGVMVPPTRNGRHLRAGIVHLGRQGVGIDGKQRSALDHVALVRLGSIVHDPSVRPAARGSRR